MKKTMLKRGAGLLFAALLLLSLLTVSVSAAEADGAKTEAAALTFGEAITAFAVAHSAEIFSALALVGTCVLSFCYRRGLLPVLTSGLSRVSGGVDRLVEGTRKCWEEGSEEIRAQLEKMTPVLQAAEGLSEGLDRLSERLAQLERETNESREERERLMILSEASVTILKEVFMAAKLPAASKEELTALYGRMRASLDKGQLREGE